MNKEEMRARMTALNDKIKGLSNKAKDSVDIAIIAGLEAKDKIDEKIVDAKGDLNALKENCRLLSERVKGKASSELLKAQMNFQVAKEEYERRKEIQDKEKLEQYIEDMVEYAEACVALAELAEEEAKLARLEALDAQAEYNEKFEDE